jgi:hypothetical protein
MQLHLGQVVRNRLSDEYYLVTALGRHLIHRDGQTVELRQVYFDVLTETSSVGHPVHSEEWEWTGFPRNWLIPVTDLPAE